MQALTPTSASRPHSHPFIPVGNERPHDGTYGPTNLSTNWSGVIESGQGTTFTAIQGDWVVPGVGASTEDEDSGTWIGIDGVDVQQLIQTGTAQDSGPDSSDPPGPYYAWVELLPNQPGVIGNSSGPAPVVPGDVMAASIVETSTDEWTIDIDDTTQNWSFSQEFSYDTPGDTAEWIEEAPTVNTGVATLADYGSTTFTELGTEGTGLASAEAIPSYMANQSGAIISYPADIDPSADSFSLFYGSPSPQVTSVTPNQGSTSGGTTVVVEGNFITGVTSVDFGGVSVPFTADIDEGTVSASSPPSSAGTVDIRVTTPGGTSQVSDADQFTYVAPPPPPSPPAQHGYWLVGSDGGIFTFGSAQFYGSTGSLHLQRPVVGIRSHCRQRRLLARCLGRRHLQLRRRRLLWLDPRSRTASCRLGTTELSSTPQSLAWCPLRMAAGTSWWHQTVAFSLLATPVSRGAARELAAVQEPPLRSCPTQAVMAIGW